MLITFAFILIRGCLTIQAEIKPYEPDAGNAAVGNSS